MEVNNLTQRYKLDVTVLGERSREVLQVPIPGQCQHATTVRMWNRKRFLADNVYLEEAPSRELRVVKQVRWSQRRSFLTELQVMGRVSKVLALLQLYMLLDTDFYCSAAGKEILRSVPRLVPVQ